MKALALLSVLSIASTGLMGCFDHDDEDHGRHHEHSRSEYRNDEHVVREDRTVIVPEHRTEVHIDR